MRSTVHFLSVAAALANQCSVCQVNCFWYDPLQVNCANFGAVITDVCHHTAVFRPETQCDNTPFVLVFSDDFESNTLDLSKWYAETNSGYDYIHINRAQNIRVGGGYLMIDSKIDPGIYTWYDWALPQPAINQFFEYTSGSIRSRYHFHEGMYEIRCSITNNCGGLWPAFWMYGQNGCNATEIDVFEYMANDMNRWTMNVHKDVPTGCGHTECQGCYEGGNTDAQLVYKAIWDRHNIVFTRSDVGVKRNYPRWMTMLNQAVGCNSVEGYYLMNSDYPRARTITDHALEIIAGVGLDNRSGVVHESDAFPSTMYIDYIKYYRRVPCSGALTLSTIEGLLSTFGEYNFITGTSVIVETGFSLPSGEQLELVARDHLDLSPGMIVNPGADFVGRIGSSNCGTPEMGAGGEQMVLDIPQSELQARAIDTDSASEEEGAYPLSDAPIVRSSSRNLVGVLLETQSVTFRLQSTLSHPADVIVYNSLGKIVLRGAMQVGTSEFIIANNLHTGLYFVVIAADEVVSVGRFSIVK